MARVRDLGLTTQISTFLISLQRYQGTDSALMIKCEKDGKDDYMSAFLKRYKTEFGFTLQNRSVLVDDVRVRGVGCTDLDTDLDEIGQGHDITEEPHPIETVQVFFDDHYEATKVYNLDQLPIGHKLQGRVNAVTEFHERKLN